MKQKDIDIALNGKCKSHYRVVLNMDDLLNVPSVDIPIDKRLEQDFGMSSSNSSKSKRGKTRRYKIKCKNKETCKVRLRMPDTSSTERKEG